MKPRGTARRRRHAAACVIACCAPALLTVACSSTPSLASVGCSGPHPDMVTAQRIVPNNRDGFQTLSVTRHSPELAGDLLHDFCLTETHLVQLHGAVDCPESFGLKYEGRFLVKGREVASYSWVASGCQQLTLTHAGESRSTSLEKAPAAAAAPDMAKDFVAVLGAPCTSAVFEPPRTGQCR